jgi:hypothetical protein
VNNQPAIRKRLQVIQQVSPHHQDVGSLAGFQDAQFGLKSQHMRRVIVTVVNTAVLLQVP